MLLEDNTNLGMKDGHFLWGALQLSLILILFLLVKVRMSVGVGLTANAQIFAADDHLQETFQILHLTLEESLRTCWDARWPDWTDLLKEVVSHYRAFIITITANTRNERLLISFLEAQMLVLSPESADRFLKVSSVVLFCYKETETQKVLSTLSNIE